MNYDNGIVGDKYQEICSQEKIIVKLAYNNYPPLLEIVNNSMVKDHYRNLEGSSIPYQHEILSIFFQQKNIQPKWIYCDGDWGSTINQTTKIFSGVIGKVVKYIT